MSKTKPPQLPVENGVPEGWANPFVREVLDVKYGKGLPEKCRKGGPYAVYGSNGVVGRHDEPLTAGPTIILGRKGTVGAVHYSRQPCWPIDTTYFVEEVPGLDMGFLYHTLSTLGLSEMDTSSAIPGLNREEVYAQVLPIPPLAEQERIVAKVETLLKRVNAAKARLAKLPAILKRFRQSVLAAACSGQLTAEWRLNNKSADVWHECALGDLFKVTTGGTPSRRNPAYFTNGKIPWVKTGEVQNGDIFEAQEFITEDAMENSSAKLFPPGTLLVALYGEGKTRGQVGRLRIQAATNQACAALVNPGMDEVTQRFVFFFLLSAYYDLRSQSAGGNQPNLSVGLIRNWTISMPPLVEQREIVRRVEALFALADKIEANVHAATAQAERLPQAILARAFRGELVPTEAELAAKEGRDYEPASALLERIRSSRQANNGHPSPGRRRKAAAVAKVNEPASAQNAIPVAKYSDEKSPRPAPIDQTDRNEVMTVIRDVFSSNGHRNRDQAIRDIAAALGYQRVGSRINEILDNDIRTAVRRGILENSLDGLRLLSRDIKEYTREFLVQQLVAGMGNAWWDREELIGSTSRWLGFRRTGPVIRGALKSAINSAIRRGILESDAARLRKA